MNPAPFIELFSSVLAVSWRAGWLILVLLGLRLAVRGRIPAQVWFVAWIVVALRLLLPFSVPARWSPYNLAAPRPAAAKSVMAASGAADAKAVTPVSMPAVEFATGGAGSPLMVAPSVEIVRTAPTAKGRTVDLRAVAGAGWLAGVGVLIVARAVVAGRFRRHLRRAGAAADERVLAAVAGATKDWGLDWDVACVETDAVDAPALYGIFRPRLLFPPGFARQLSDEELRLVVRHELAHWRRRDLVAQGLMQAAVVLHWFNPLVWLAARLARTDCELACDEFVLRRESTGGANAYGATLLKVLGIVRGQRRPSAVVAIFEGRRQLAHRVRMIAGYRATTLSRVLGGILLVATVGAASMTRESRAAAPAAAAAAPAKPEVAPGGPEEGNSNRAVPAGPVSSKASLTSESFLEKSAGGRDLQTAIEAQQQQVEELARDLEAFKEKEHLVSPDQAADDMNATLRAANAELLRAEQNFAAAEMRLAQMKEYRARHADLSDLPFIANQPLVGKLKQDLVSLRIEMAASAEKYLERHPTVVSLARVVAETEKQLAQAVESACQRVEAEGKEARRSWDYAEQMVDQRKSQVRRFDKLVKAWRDKLHALQTQEEILQTMISRQTEQRMADLVPSGKPEAAAPTGFSISVAGAVHQQGAIGFAAEETPIVLDAIARAGGFTARANRNAVRVVRSGPDGTRTTSVLSEHELTTGTGPQAILQRGDVVFVPELPAELEARPVSILGAVGSPGNFNYSAPPDGRMTLVDLLAKAGGGTRIANLRAVRVTRVNEKDRSPKAFTVNIAAFLGSDGGENFDLQPGDIVFVPERTL